MQHCPFQFGAKLYLQQAHRSEARGPWVEADKPEGAMNNGAACAMDSMARACFYVNTRAEIAGEIVAMQDLALKYRINDDWRLRLTTERA